jgi:aldehyde:ferredoxin oxidoreductase
VAFPVLDIPDALVAIHEMLEAHTGTKYDIEDLMQMGREVLTMERLYNTSAGFTQADDRLPAFFYTEKLPPHDSVFTVTDADLDSVFDFVPETAKEMGLQ